MRLFNPFYFVKVPQILTSLYLSKAVWHGDRTQNVVYLTFDDGPSTHTPMILDILDQYEIKASFFCVGEQIISHPEIFDQIKIKGHCIGHHTYSHEDGWRAKKNDYLASVHKAAKLSNSIFFRPPYGRLRPSLIRQISQRYKIIMWDVMNGDFDDKKPINKVIEDTLLRTLPGSIIVMHDRQRAQDMIPAIIEGILEKGLRFGTIDELS